MSPESLTSRRQAEDALITKAQQDEAFRRELLSNPSAAISRTLGVDLPSDLKITVLQETRDTMYLVLPPPINASGELAEHELAAVAGGREALGDDPGSGWGKIEGFFMGGEVVNPGSQKQL